MTILKSAAPPVFSPDEVFEQFVRTECCYLTSGTTRTVYTTHDNLCVVKIAKEHGDTTYNWIEIAAYFYYKCDQEMLALVHSWSVSGKYLVMEKLNMVEQPPEDFSYPSWVTDRKLSNIGVDTSGNFKICDYAMVRDDKFGYESDYV